MSVYPSERERQRAVEMGETERQSGRDGQRADGERDREMGRRERSDDILAAKWLVVQALQLEIIAPPHRYFLSLSPICLSLSLSLSLSLFLSFSLSLALFNISFSIYHWSFLLLASFRLNYDTASSHALPCGANPSYHVCIPVRGQHIPNESLSISIFSRQDKPSYIFSQKAGQGRIFCWL